MQTHPCRLSAGFFVPLFLLCAPLAGALAEDVSEDMEILTKGPVHEAFAQTVQLNPEPGPVITATPPEPVEELAPEQKPEGKNVVWIPGYWAWDDQRSEFLWVSGVWRDTPPGREWVPGYWNPVAGGVQWIPGYWAPKGKITESTRTDTTPPKSLEYGPVSTAPTPDHIWVPGTWVWQSRYVWRPGYWTVAHPDLCWIPATYAWTPYGYVYVEGYWDYPLAHRGVLFAPVYWRPAPVVYVRRYSPSVVIHLSFVSDCLFVRPAYHHYYFGNYYDHTFISFGFYSTRVWYSRHGGCEPLYARRRWEHRHDRDWHRREKEREEHRYKNPEARPPERYTAGKNNFYTADPSKKDAVNQLVAAPLDSSSLTAGKDNSPAPKLVKLDKKEREALTREAKQLEKDRRDQAKTALKLQKETDKAARKSGPDDVRNITTNRQNAQPPATDTQQDPVSPKAEEATSANKDNGRGKDKIKDNDPSGGKQRKEPETPALIAEKKNKPERVQPGSPDSARTEPPGAWGSKPEQDKKQKVYLNQKPQSRNEPSQSPTPTTPENQKAAKPWKNPNPNTPPSGYTPQPVKTVKVKNEKTKVPSPYVDTYGKQKQD